MTRFLAAVGSFVFGTAGWWVGEQFGGMFTAFTVSMIGTGFGIYLGKRLADRWGT